MAGGARAFVAVLTRPAGQSAALAARLNAAGIETIEFPLIEIVALAPGERAPLSAALAGLERYALVVFVSPNAVEHALAQLAALPKAAEPREPATEPAPHEALPPPQSWPPSVPVAVVGPGSVAALARHGIAAPGYRVIAPAGDDADAPPRQYDSEALYAALETAFATPSAEPGGTPGAPDWRGKRVLIVRGDGGREWLADRLREAGAEIDTVTAYRRRVPEPSIAAWQRIHALLSEPQRARTHGWLLTSSEGVRNLLSLAESHLHPTERGALAKAACVVPHARIAEAARAAGFDRITQSGADEEEIVRVFRTLAEQAALAAHAASVPSRMTTTNETPSPAFPSASQPSGPKRSRSTGGTAVLWLALLIAVGAAGAGGYILEHKLQKLSQRNDALNAQMIELRATAGQSSQLAQQTDNRIAALSAKLADAQTAQQALQQQYQDLARNRDSWLIEEVGQMVAGASQQLQLTGNTQLALIALQNADQRLASAQSPQALVVRKALAADIERLKAAPVLDLSGLAIKLDDAIGRIDALPLAGEAHVALQAPPAAVVKTAPGESNLRIWWNNLLASAGQELKGLVQVRRIDNADAMLAAPEQGRFLRENLKLRLLSARLSLLSRNQSAMKSDLHAAQAELARYFDGASADTKTVEDLLRQVDAAPLTVTVPNLSASLNAVQQFQSQNRG